MPAKRQSARRSTASKRRTSTARASARRHPARRVKIPRGGPLHARLGSWLVLRVVVPMVADRRSVMQSRKDAAILRATHKGCTTCQGLGQIHTRNKKTGELTGSKPCPAKPTKERASRLEVQRAARFGANKNTGLIGWSCPCGKKEKPRYRDARTATVALRTHEKAKHGGQTVGGAWYAQTNATAPQPMPQQPAPVSKAVTGTGKTDEEWIKQNKPMPVGKAIAAGKCWQCSGNGKIYSVFGGQQLIVVCGQCKGNGKAPVAAKQTAAP